jgi:DNA-binding NarL/FixJ family response regulator
MEVMLSPREREIFTLLVNGLGSKDIAARLRISPRTVDTYRATLMRKLNVHDFGDCGMAGSVGVPAARPPRLPHRPPRSASAEPPSDFGES